MALSAAAHGDSSAATATMKLFVMLQGKQLVFLVDSGSTHFFLDSSLLSTLSGVQSLKMPVKVKVAMVKLFTALSFCLMVSGLAMVLYSKINVSLFHWAVMMVYWGWIGWLSWALWK